MEYTEGGVVYTYFIESGVASITGVSGAYGSIVIPSVLGGCPVTSMSSNLFYNNTLITAIVIPDSVVGMYEVFFGCTNLRTITLGSGLMYIGGFTFNTCTSLLSITIPASVTTIGAYAFNGCTALSSVTFLGATAPTVNANWFGGSPAPPFVCRGHASSTSDFPLPGSLFYGLTMGTVIPPITYAPSVPLNPNATTGNLQVLLAWETPTSNGGSSITKYNIYRSTTSGGVYLYIGSSTVLSYLDSGLTNGATYYYRITAVNIAGESPQTNYIGATPTTITAPGVPTNMALTLGTNNIIIGWTAPSNGGSVITSYNIYRSNALSGTFTRIASPITTSYVDYNVIDNQSYWYQISAVNAIGEGTRTGAVSATLVATGMDPPTNVTIKLFDINPVISWEPPTDTPCVTSYNVYMGITSPPTTKITSVPANKFSAMHVVGTQGMRYYYAVTAVNGSEESELSTIVDITYGARTGSERNKIISMNNIVKNGSFDVDDSNWESGSGTVACANNTEGGFVYDQHVVVSDTLLNQSANIVPGHTYIYTLRGRKTSTGAKNPKFYMWNEKNLSPNVKVVFDDDNINLKSGVYTADMSDTINTTEYGIYYGIGGLNNQITYELTSQHSQGYASVEKEPTANTMDKLFTKARSGNYSYNVPEYNYGSLNLGNREPTGLYAYAIADDSTATVRRGFLSFLTDANSAYITSARIHITPAAGVIPHIYIVRNYGSWMKDDNEDIALFYNSSSYRGDHETADEDLFGEAFPSTSGQFDIVLNTKGIEYIRQAAGELITFAVRCDADYMNDSSLVSASAGIQLDASPATLITVLDW